MSNFARAALRNWIPPAAMHFLQSWFGSVRFLGDYPTWEAAKRECAGYDSDAILERVKAASLAVKEGRAEFERDSVLFDKIQYSWPVLASLLRIACRNEGNLHVLDFGGSLGSSYRQNRGFLSGLKSLRWSVVEQAHFVECGQKYFQDEALRFFPDIDSCVAYHRPNVILLSSVLNYLEHPYETLQSMIDLGIDYILIDRTPFLEGMRDRLTVQKVSERIYPASYPAWFFSREKFLTFFQGRYRLMEEFDSLDKANFPSHYLGFLLSRSDLPPR